MTETTKKGFSLKSLIPVSVGAGIFSFATPSFALTLSDVLDPITAAFGDGQTIGWTVLAGVAVLMGFVIMLRMLGLMGR